MRRIYENHELREFYAATFPRSDPAYMWWLHERIESLIEAIYTKILRPGDIVIDLGCHSGRHSIPMSRAIGNTGRVLAFDPLETPLAHLKQEIRTQQITNIEIYNFALSNRTGESTFIEYSQLPAYSSFKEHLYIPEEFPVKKILSVPVKRLDDFFEQQLPELQDQISFIKADIEGAEFHTFVGGLHTIARSQPIIIFENSKQTAATRFGYSADEYFSFFEAIRYEIYDMAGVRMTFENWNFGGPSYAVVAVLSAAKSTQSLKTTSRYDTRAINFRYK